MNQSFGACRLAKEGETWNSTSVSLSSDDSDDEEDEVRVMYREGFKDFTVQTIKNIVQSKSLLFRYCILE